MSEKTAIVHLTQYPISVNEFSALSKDQQAGLAIVSYAVSESNVFAKLFIAAAHDPVDEAVIDSSIAMQQFTILRAWSAKLFEVEAFLCLGGKKKESEDVLLLKIAAECLNEFSVLRQHEGYPITRDLRNEATSHYSFSSARKNLEHLSQSFDASMYLNEQTGNSFYPLGEEVMFVGRINRRAANLTDKAERMKILESWMNWNIQANQWLVSCHNKFVRQLLFDRFENKYARKRVFWVPPALSLTKEEAKVPIFYRKNY